MKNTPFTHKHLELGAKMAEFAGLQYADQLYRDQ